MDFIITELLPLVVDSYKVSSMMATDISYEAMSLVVDMDLALLLANIMEMIMFVDLKHLAFAHLAA